MGSAALGVPGVERAAGAIRATVGGFGSLEGVATLEPDFEAVRCDARVCVADEERVVGATGAVDPALAEVSAVGAAASPANAALTAPADPAAVLDFALAVGGTIDCAAVASSVPAPGRGPPASAAASEPPSRVGSEPAGGRSPAVAGLPISGGVAGCEPSNVPCSGLVGAAAAELPANSDSARAASPPGLVSGAGPVGPASTVAVVPRPAPCEGWCGGAGADTVALPTLWAGVLNTSPVSSSALSSSSGSMRSIGLDAWDAESGATALFCSEPTGRAVAEDSPGRPSPTVVAGDAPSSTSGSMSSLLVDTPVVGAGRASGGTALPAGEAARRGSPASNGSSTGRSVKGSSIGRDAASINSCLLPVRKPRQPPAGAPANLYTQHADHTPSPAIRHSGCNGYSSRSRPPERLWDARNLAILQRHGGCTYWMAHRSM
jgi:hypothetical protein